MAALISIVGKASADTDYVSITETIEAFEAHKLGVVQAADTLESIFRQKGLLYEMDIAPWQVPELTVCRGNGQTSQTAKQDTAVQSSTVVCRLLECTLRQFFAKITPGGPQWFQRQAGAPDSTVEYSAGQHSTARGLLTQFPTSLNSKPKALPETVRTGNAT
jgi:hypothetical protein